MIDKSNLRFTDSTQVVNRIDSVLKLRGSSRKEIAAMLGLNVQVFTNWSMRGSFPSATALFQISDVLNVSAEWLMFGEDRGLTGDDAHVLNMYRKLEEKDRYVVRSLLEILSNE